MPKTHAPFVLVLITLLSAACGASSVSREVTMPATAIGETGSIELVFSREASGVIVAVEGQLVVRGAKVELLTIRNVEAGYANIAIAAEGVERQFRVLVEPNRATTVPIGAAPMPPEQSPFLTAGISVAALLLSRSVTSLLF